MSDTKPDVDASAIPADLQQLRQWVCWRKELRGERLQKVPYRAITGGEAKASTSDPNTWGSFKDAVAVYESSNGRYDGIGFMFSLGDPYAGVDLDGCIGPDGKVVSEAQAIIDRLGSYTEVSPSGKGVKVFIKGSLPEKARNRTKDVAGFEQIEFYDRTRYFTVTGNHLPGTPMTIEDREDELLAVHGESFGSSPARSSHESQAAANRTEAQPATASDDHEHVAIGDAAPEPSPEDAALLQRIRDSKDGDRFRLLYDHGDTSDYDSHSEADLALCSFLAKHTSDPDQIDRLFRSSKLMRPKWDEPRGDETYGQMTIQRAMNGEQPARPAPTWQVYGLADTRTLIQPPSYVVEGLLPRPGLFTFFGAPGGLKSLLLTDLGVSVAAGRPWLPPVRGTLVKPWTTNQTPTMLIDLDNGLWRTAQRLAALVRQHGLSDETQIHFMSAPTPWPDASDPDSMAALAEQLRALDIGLCIIDNLGAISGGADENSSQMIPVMSNLRRLAEDTGSAVVVVHHVRKGTNKGGRQGDRLRGHSSIEGNLDLSLLCERDAGSRIVTLRSTKSRDVDIEPFAAEFHYTHKDNTSQLETAHFLGVLVDKQRRGRAALERAILSAIEGNRQLNGTEVVAAVKATLREVGEKKIRSTLSRLATDGKVIETHGNGNAKLYSLPEHDDEK